MELKAWIDYRSPGAQLSYWRSESGFEVDFIIDNEVAIEVKAASIAQERHLAGLRALREGNVVKRFILVCREERARKVDGIDILPWREFLEQLWSGENRLSDPGKGLAAFYYIEFAALNYTVNESDDDLPPDTLGTSAPA